MEIVCGSGTEQGARHARANWWVPNRHGVARGGGLYLARICTIGRDVLLLHIAQMSQAAGELRVHCVVLQLLVHVGGDVPREPSTFINNGHEAKHVVQDLRGWHPTRVAGSKWGSKCSENMHLITSTWFPPQAHASALHTLLENIDADAEAMPLYFRILRQQVLLHYLQSVPVQVLQHQVRGTGGQLPPPPVTVGRRPPGGGGGGLACRACRGAHAPKAKCSSITGSAYLPLPSLWPYHHPKPNHNFAASWFSHASHVDLAEQDPPNFVHGCFLAYHCSPFWTQTLTLTLAEG